MNNCWAKKCMCEMSSFKTWNDRSILPSTGGGKKKYDSSFPSWLYSFSTCPVLRLGGVIAATPTGIFTFLEFSFEIEGLLFLDNILIAFRRQLCSILLLWQICHSGPSRNDVTHFEFNITPSPPPKSLFLKFCWLPSPPICFTFVTFCLDSLPQQFLADPCPTGPLENPLMNHCRSYLWSDNVEKFLSQIVHLNGFSPAWIL